MFDVCLSVVDELEVGAGDDLFLRELLAHPGEYLGAGDAVALHDAADAHFQGGGDDDDAIHETGDARLVHDGTLEPLEPACLEVAEHGGVDDGVDGG